MIDKIVIVSREKAYVGDDKGFVSYGFEDIKKYGLKGERAFSHSFIRDTMRKLLGRTLTIVDASMLDKSQNKAVKDMIRNAFSDELEFSTKLGYDEAEIQKFIPEDVDVENLETVTIDEALEA